MKIHYLSVAAALAVVSISCNGTQSSEEETKTQPEQSKTIYEAKIDALNTSVTGGATTGTARFAVEGETMTVTIDIKNAPAGIEHWQHFHGFTNDNEAACATMAEDKNGDGIIDVVETEPVSGTTMVPFNELPAKMEVGSDTYPKAAEDGSYHYEAKVSVKDLDEAFAKAFGNAGINLDKRVLYIHGVPADTKLSESVASIADIPAHITLPIACGKINKIQ